MVSPRVQIVPDNIAMTSLETYKYILTEHFICLPLVLVGMLTSLLFAVLIAVPCGFFSCIVTYFDSYSPGIYPPTPLSPAKYR